MTNEELKERYKGVSASSLSKFEISLKLFKAYIDKEIIEEEKPWLELGTKLHMYLLEPKEFEKNYIYLDFNTPSSAKQKEFCEELVKIKKYNSGNTLLDIKFADIAVEVYKSVYASAGKSDEKIKLEALKTISTLTKYIEYLTIKDHYKEVINYSTLKFLGDAKTEIKKHSIASKLLFPSDTTSDIYSEERILWEHPTVKIGNENLVLKSFLDRFIIDHQTKQIILVDLKTTSNIGEFEDSFKKYNYSRQLSMYWLAIHYWLNTVKDDNYKEKVKLYEFKSYIVVVQTPNNSNQIPIECRVYPIADETIQNEYQNLEILLQEIAWHFENDIWDHTRSYYENGGLEKSL